jgi:hypothetical protein
MRALNRLFPRLLNFTTRRRGDERLIEEMESHTAARTEKNIRAGMTPDIRMIRARSASRCSPLPLRVQVRNTASSCSVRRISAVFDRDMHDYLY